MRFKRPSIFSSEAGNSLVETGFFLPLLLLLLMGVADFGRAYYLAIEVAGAAHAGAVYGAQNITDTTGMQNAAKLNAPRCERPRRHRYVGLRVLRWNGFVCKLHLHSHLLGEHGLLREGNHDRDLPPDRALEGNQLVNDPYRQHDHAIRK